MNGIVEFTLPDSHCEEHDRRILVPAGAVRCIHTKCHNGTWVTWLEISGMPDLVIAENIEDAMAKWMGEPAEIK
jgi:hypothetical protein